jgi:hypothetical protein
MAFQGIDIAMHKVFKAMDLQVLIKPLLDTSPLDKFDKKLF